MAKPMRLDALAAGFASLHAGQGVMWGRVGLRD